MPARTSSGTRCEPMLPAPATSTEALRGFSGMGFLVLGPPGGLAGQGGRLEGADAAVRRERPALAAGLAVGGLHLVEPAAAVGALHGRLAVAHQAAAHRAGARPGPGRGAEDNDRGCRLGGEEEAPPADE